MSRVGKLVRKLKSNTEGLAATEFGLIAVPFSVLLMGAFDLGYKNYVRSVMQGTLTEAARIVSTENPVVGAQVDENGDDIEDTLENRIRFQLEKKINTVARNATFTIDIKSYAEFSGVGKPEKLTNDVNQNGQYDEDDNDCWEDLNDNGVYDLAGGRDDDIGGASDIIFYDLNVEMPRLFPLSGLIGASDKYEINVQTAFRTQPFDVQYAPPTLCAEDV